MGEWVPEPELAEDHHSDNGGHVGVSGAGLERDGHIATSRVNDSLSDDGSELGHDIFMLIANNLCVQLAVGGDLRARNLILLYEDHGRCDERSLAYVVDWVIGHGLEQGQRLFQPGP